MANNLNIDSERRDFQAWIRSDASGYEFEAGWDNFKLRDDGRYRDARWRNAWDVWQARASAGAPLAGAPATAPALGEAGELTAPIGTPEGMRAYGKPYSKGYAAGLKKGLGEAGELAKLREAVQKVLSFRDGELPTRGWMRDNDASRKALHDLAAALPHSMGAA